MKRILFLAIVLASCNAELKPAQGIIRFKQYTPAGSGSMNTSGSWNFGESEKYTFLIEDSDGEVNPYKTNKQDFFAFEVGDTFNYRK